MYKIDDELKREIIKVARETGNDEAITIIEEADDPVLWAERNLRHPDTGDTTFKVKTAFKPLLRSNHKDRAIRVGRQFGKTVHMVVDILHNLVFRKNVVILVFVTSLPLMNRMLTLMSNMTKNTEIGMMLSQKKRNKRANSSVDEEYDHAVYVTNGNKVYFFAMNKDPDKARGQFATDIYVDEADYMPDKAWPVISGILKRDPSIRLWASSTPSGITGSWFEKFCEKCARDDYKDGAEFHIPSTLDEEWELIEPRLRASIHDEISWKLEVLAEFVEPKGAVYKKEVVDSAFARWAHNSIYPTLESILETAEYRNGLKFLGVDWNTPQNGVRIVELTRMWGKLLLTRHIVIAYEEYTQLSAVSKVVELMTANNYAIISVDEGYGATQIELLRLELANKGYDVGRVLNVVDSNTYETISVEYRSPMTGEVQRKEYMKVKTKFRIVGLLGQYLETELALPQEETNHLGAEIRNFRRKGKASDGGFIYSDDSHSLSALHVCIHGYEKYMREVGVHDSQVDFSGIIVSSQLTLERSYDEGNTPFYYRQLDSNSIQTHRTRGLHGYTRRTRQL